MKITIKVLKGQDCTLDNVNANDTVLCIKQKLESALNIPLTSQKLLYLGRTLNDDNTIEFYRIKDGTKLNLIVSSKTDLREIMYKNFRKHFSDAVAEKLAKEFITVFNSKLHKMSLDDLERIATQL